MLTLVVMVALAAASPATAGAEFDHSHWDHVLKRFVSERGEVDYAALRRDPAEMQAYLAEVSASSPVNKPQLFPTRAHVIAYWINAYNAFVTWGVAQRYPVKSVRDIGLVSGFFRIKAFTAGGVSMSPDNVEHDTLRLDFHEPRIHFAIVCASLGCPFLSRDAYLGATLESQLDAAAKRFVNEDRNVAIDLHQKSITLSKIFEWYSGDFGGNEGVRRFILSHTADDKRRAVEVLKDPVIRYRDYDWGINDPGSRK